MEKRYKALRTIGSIYKVVGIIVGVLTILAAIAACGVSLAGSAAMSDFMDRPGMLGGALGGGLMALGILLYGGFTTLAMYGVGEAVFLLLDLEENTRASAEAARATSALLHQLTLPKPSTPKE